MGIILILIFFWALLKSIKGKQLSIIGRGLMSALLNSFTNLLYLIHIATYVTWHELIKFTTLHYHYSKYLIMCISYGGSVNCIKLHCLLHQYHKFHWQAVFPQKDTKLQISKSNQIFYAYTAFFLMPGHILWCKKLSKNIWLSAMYKARCGSRILQGF